MPDDQFNFDTDPDSTLAAQAGTAGAGTPANAGARAEEPAARAVTWGLVGQNTYEELAFSLGGGRARGVRRRVPAGVTYTAPWKDKEGPRNLPDMLWRPVRNQAQCY